MLSLDDNYMTIFTVLFMLMVPAFLSVSLQWAASFQSLWEYLTSGLQLQFIIYNL